MKQLWNASVALPVMTSLPICLSAADVPNTPRIDCIVMAEQQPHESDAALFWYHDFDNPEQQERYAEKEGNL